MAIRYELATVDDLAVARDGIAVYTTLAALNADLRAEDGELARVTRDGLNNGTYVKTGAPDTGGWEPYQFDRVGLVEGRVDGIEPIVDATAELHVPVISRETSLPDLSTRNNTSTFSGWGGPVGVRQDFNEVGFKVHSWDTNEPVTRVRVQVREGDHQGVLLADVTADVSVPFGVDTVVRVRLPSRIQNAGGERIWIMFWTNGRTGTASLANDSHYPASEGYPQARYSTSRDVDSIESTNPLTASSIWFELSNLDVEHTTAAPRPAFAERVGEIIGVPALESGLGATTRGLYAVAEMQPDVVSSEDSLPYLPDMRNNESIISGWGGPVGVRQNFNRVGFWIQSWEASQPVTEVLVQVRVGGHNGTVIGAGRADVTLDHNVPTLVFVDLDETVENPTGDNLWIWFFANGLTGTRRIVSDDSYYPESEGYPRGRYATNGEADYSPGQTLPSPTSVWFRIERTDPEHLTAVPTQAFADAVVEKAQVTPSARHESDHFGRWLLRDWQAQVAKIHNGSTTAQAVLALFGDSWVGGRHRIAQPLRQMLTDRLGDAGPGYCGIGNNHGGADTGAVTLVRSGAWTDSDQQPTSRGVDIAHAQSDEVGAAVTINALTPTTSAIIHWWRQTGGGAYRYRVDGGAWQSVSTSGTAGYQTTTIAGLTDAPHTVEIEVESAGTAGVILMGVDLRRAGAGVRVHKLGNGGLTGGQATAVGAAGWQIGLAALEPTSVGILLGTNDMSQRVPLTTFAEQITTLIERVRAARPMADVFLIAPADNNLEGRPNTMEEFTQTLLEVAQNEGAGYVDLLRPFGSFADADARGLYQDGVHPNADGGRLIASLVYDRLLRVG